MTLKVTQPLLVLADANVIIELHKLGLWRHILQNCQVYTTSSIAKHEAEFYKPRKSSKVPIKIQEDIESGSLHILEASVEDLARLYDIFEETFLASIHDGEREALALIAANKHEDCLFCTSDGPAIQALVMIRKDTLGLSLEKLLRNNGFSNKIDLIPPWCTEKTYNLRIRDGALNVVSGEGLIDKSRS